jgi:hypothetical protein
MWPKGKTIEDVVVIGTEEGGLYKLKGHLDVALTHFTESPCELWHRILAHINYKALPYVSKVVTGLPELKVDHEDVCNGCALGFKTRKEMFSRKKREVSHLKIFGCPVFVHIPK